MAKKKIYKIIFLNQDKVYEIYAEHVNHGAMFGFIEAGKLIFGERSSVVVDPGEESLKTEFSDVDHTYIPMHSIIRIDEVQKKGSAKITNVSEKGENVMSFPVYTRSSNDMDKK